MAIEAAVILPFFVMLLLMGLDIWRSTQETALVAHYAEAGAVYGRASVANSVNTAGITSAACMDAGTDAPVVTSSVSGGFVTVRVVVQFQFLTPLPGLPTQLVATRSYYIQRGH